MRRRVDIPLVVAAFVVVAAGLATTYSTSPAAYRHQVVWAALSIAVGLAAALLPARRLKWLAVPSWVLTLALLCLVHLHGESALGARRWLSIGGFPLEPSEPAKVLMIVALAAVLGWREERPGVLQLAIVAALSLPVLMLLVLQPDIGTAIVFVTIVLGMLFVSGLRTRYLVAAYAGSALAALLAVRFLHGYQRERLAVFLDPGRDPLGAGYNLLQARIAIGSGGLWGRGWMSEGQGRLGFLPERTTDFAFATWSEQFGLLGGVLLIAIFAILVWRVLRVAAAADDLHGRLLASAVGIMLAVQVFENVGMNIGLTPVAGIPLPLFSYGGSSLLATACALGIVQSVARAQGRVVHAAVWTPPVEELAA